MRIGFSGDWHTDNMKRTYLVDGVPNRQRDTDAQVDFMIAECRRLKVTFFFILGDLFETHYVKGYHFARAVDYIRKFLKAGIHVAVLSGNHEVSEGGSSVMMALKRLKDEGLFIIDKSGLFGCEGVKFLCFPHERREVFSEYKTYTDYVKARTEKFRSQFDAVVGHFQPTNVSTRHDNETFVGSSRLLDASIFPKHTPVFCGHVHAPLDKSNLHILGSPTKMFFGEAEDKKRFLIWDTEKNAFKSVPLNCQPMKVWRFDSSAPIAKIFADIREEFRDAMVKVDVSSTSRDISVSKQYVQSLMGEVNAHVISFATHREKKETSASLKKNEVVEMKPTSLFRATIRSFVKDAEERKRLEQLGLSILEECSDAQSD